MTLSLKEAGLKELDHFREAHIPGNAATRLERIRAIAPQFKLDFVKARPVIAVRTLDVSLAPYPVTFAFNRACRLRYPYLLFHNRAMLVQFWQRGAPKILLMNPTIPRRSIEAPFFKHIEQNMKRKVPFADAVADRFMIDPPVHEQLAKHGLTVDDVDYVAFDHQHVQDLRPYLGTSTEKPVYPRAKYLVQAADYESTLKQHPLQKTWFVPHGGDDVKTDRLVLLRGDVELGEGCALLFTPGHTWGNQSLLFRAPESGCYTVSENAVCMDCYTPEHSSIPGLASHAREYGVEVIMNANTLEGSLDQYNSMVKEKLLADPFVRDGRFVQHFSSSELVHSPIAPGLRPTWSVTKVNEGELERAAASTVKPAHATA